MTREEHDHIMDHPLYLINEGFYYGKNNGDNLIAKGKIYFDISVGVGDDWEWRDMIGYTVDKKSALNTLKQVEKERDQGTDEWEEDTAFELYETTIRKYIIGDTFVPNEN